MVYVRPEKPFQGCRGLTLVRRIRRGSAPKAARIPISRALRATVKDKRA
jgi:hypothetical protein